MKVTGIELFLKSSTADANSSRERTPGASKESSTRVLHITKTESALLKGLHTEAEFEARSERFKQAEVRRASKRIDREAAEKLRAENQ